MQFLSKIFFVSSLLFFISFSSCSDDGEGNNGDCTVCDAVDISEGGVVVQLPDLNICVGDDDGSGGTVTQELIDELVDTYLAVGGTCN